MPIWMEKANTGQANAARLYLLVGGDPEQAHSSFLFRYDAMV